MRQVYGTKVTRLTPGRPVDLPPETGVLPALRGAGMGRQESAEAVVAGPAGEGPNMECRTERTVLRWRDKTQKTGPRCPVPMPRAAAGNREGRHRVHQTPRQDRHPLDRRQTSD
jgi:hypothetical protein